MRFMIPRRAPLAIAAILAVCSEAIPASADDVFGEPSGTVTETTVFRYHFDNRNTDPLDDEYGEWVNRLNGQATSGRFTLSLRVDSAMFFHTPNPNELARADASKPPAEGEVREPTFLLDQTNTYGTRLSDRYVNVVYPAKFALRYKSRHVESTVGDYYVQLGKGLVLSLRKIDELAADTTLRGGIVRVTPELGDLKLEATALAGASNPVRIDDVSGRLLSQRTSGFAEQLAYPIVPTPNETDYVRKPEPTFAPDVILGGQVEAGTKAFQVGVRGVQLTRTDAPFLTGDTAVASRNAKRILMGSVSINVPVIADHGSFYAEVAGQKLDDFGPRANTDLMGALSSGYGAYVLGTFYHGPVTVSLEGKHNHQLFPLTANTDPSAPEFSTLQYNVPPTTEPITSDTQFGLFNVCVTGGRGRVNYRVAQDTIVHASLGRYRTYSERSERCGQERRAEADGSEGERIGKSAEIRNDVWDPFVGTEIMYEGGRSHFMTTTGVRFDDSGEPQSFPGAQGLTRVYYREHYVRYMLSKTIWGPWSGEIVGFHRFRYEPARSRDPWREGENYVSASYSPTWLFALGYEYSTEGGDRVDFYNGMVQFRPTTDSTLRAFVGQTRPALRCVSGLCRQFPAFEGAKLEGIFTF